MGTTLAQTAHATSTAPFFVALSTCGVSDATKNGGIGGGGGQAGAIGRSRDSWLTGTVDAAGRDLSPTADGQDGAP